MASSNPSPPLRGFGAHHDWWAVIFLVTNDRARDGKPSPARLHAYLGSCELNGAHSYADTSFLSQCSGDGPSNGGIIGAVTIGVITAVTTAISPVLSPRPAPLWCVLVAGFGVRCLGPRIASIRARSRPLASFIGWGSPWVSSERIGPLRRATVRFCVRLRVVLCGASRHTVVLAMKPSKMVSRARVGSNRMVFRVGSLTGVINGPWLVVFSRIGDDHLPDPLKPPAVRPT